MIDLVKTMRVASSTGNIRKIIKSNFHLLSGRSEFTRVLMKDPIAVFSTEWLATTFNMDVIIMIRHPAAFAYSLKKKNWRHPFSHFLKQRSLMRDYLYPFADEIREFACEEKSLVEQAGLLWKLIYHTIVQFRQKHPGWIYIRHEDISTEPMHYFEKILNQLNVKITNGIRQAILETTKASNPVNAREPADPLVRDSRSLVHAWKKGLTAREIQLIRKRVDGVFYHFYSNDDW